MELPDRAMTIEEVAAKLQINVDTMYFLHATGKAPPAFKAGRAWRYDPDKFKTWCENGGSVASEKGHDR